MARNAITIKQEADFEEGRPTDADALSPDWDHTVLDDLAEADSQTDTGNSLNGRAGAAKLGDIGFRVQFDDATAAYITVNATAVDRTQGTIDIWFNPKEVSLADGKVINIASFRDGAGAQTWWMRLEGGAGSFQMQALYRTDGGGSMVAGTHAFSSDNVYVHFRMAFKRSSGAGNDDGFVYFRADDNNTISTYSATGIDNDTIDWDVLRAGMDGTNAAAFGGSYDFDEVRISESVSPVWITSGAALAGSYGAAFTIEGTGVRFIQFTGPTNETTTTMEARLDPNTLTMATNDAFRCFQMNGSGAANPAAAVVIKWDGSNYFLTPEGKNDSSGDVTTGDHQITDAPHTVRLVYGVSSGAGNDDGFIHMYVDNKLAESITNIDNDGLDVDNVFFGAVGELDSGTSGVFFMDDMWWSDDLPASWEDYALFVAKFKSYMFPAKEKDYEFEATSTHYTFYARKPDEVK